MTSPFRASTGSAFPWTPLVPPGHCELCHRASDRLAVIEVAPGARIQWTVVRRTETGARLPRRVPVCPRHAGGNGVPLATPNTTTLAGTTALRPQRERLFDAIPYRTAGEAERRWTA